MMRKGFVVFLMVWLSTTSLCGWWDTGHMVVAKIAYDRLEPEVRKQVDELSALYAPYFPESPDFITASCWPDDISGLGMKAFAFWHISSDPYDPEGILTSAELARKQKKPWSQDSRWAVKQCLTTLKRKKASLWTKAFMLRFMIHIVGDLHQPLHCTTFYSANFPKGDRGGTRYPIEGEIKTLHFYWDSMCGLGAERLERPLDERGAAVIAELAERIVEEYPETKELSLKLDDWKQESYQLGQEVVYQGILPGETPSQAYEARGQMVAKRQVALAGYRLARLLNKTLKAS